MCCEHCASGAGLIDFAIEEGRIRARSREAFVKMYELSPDLVVETLAASQPDALRASQNHMASISEEEDTAMRADIAQQFGIPLEAVA